MNMTQKIVSCSPKFYPFWAINLIFYDFLAVFFALEVLEALILEYVIV